MPHPAWEDLSEFFDPSEFATTATMHRDDEDPVEVLGIFDDPNMLGDLGEYRADVTQPQFVCAESDADVFERGDLISIEGKQFELMEDPRLDGTGIARLVLSEHGIITNAGI